VTHEYTILYDALVLTGDPACPRAEAVGIAADTILAVGDTAGVRAISRGDSRFIALRGRIVTPWPVDPATAARLATAEPADLAGLEALLCPPGARGGSPTIEIGSRADLAIWRLEGAQHDSSGSSVRPPSPEAVLLGGSFAEGDPVRGPYALDAAIAPRCLDPESAGEPFAPGSRPGG
jgi:hypothetical protein